jgi:two-component system, cell cycle sensor histidine kinase and response regulator CckA
MDKRQRILIVDDNPNIREGLLSLLSPHQGFDIVGVACDGREAVQAVDQFLPDLVLMDLSMPRMGGIAATREIKGQHPETKILALTVHKSEEYITAALKAGADGYILKDAPHAELIQSIEKTLGGMRVLSLGVEEALRESEEALKKSEEKYRDLVENINDVIFEIDENQRISYISPTSEAIFGLPPSDLIGRPMMDFLFPADRSLAGESFQKISSGQPHPIEVRLVNQFKEIRWVRISSRPITKMGQVLGFRGILTDLTEEKRRDEERMIMSKLEATGILAGGIAHDFNSLLTVILGNLELAKISPRINKTLATYLENAEKAVTAARSLTQQFITFATGDAPVKRLISLTGLLKEQARFTLRGSPVGYKCTISPELWPTHADGNQIGQVLRNIILNAREAMPQGGKILIGATNWVVVASSDLPLPEGNYVRVTIADRGGGIPEEVLPKIFDPYFSTRQRGDQKGMGLGLTICHSVIQKHGGAITVSSQTGKGTIFQVYLPALPPRVIERPALPQGLPMKGRILVMDDEEMMRILVGEILGHLGYEIQSVEDGEKALACFREAQAQGNPFDAVILDLIVSGGMGGKETIEELLKIDPSVKAIVSSGYSNDPVMVEFNRHGFKGALSKPYGINDLRDILCNVIGIDQFIKAGP